MGITKNYLIISIVRSFEQQNTITRLRTKNITHIDIKLPYNAILQGMFHTKNHYTDIFIKQTL